MANTVDSPVLLEQSHSTDEVSVSAPSALGQSDAAASASDPPTISTETPLPPKDSSSSSSATDSRPAVAPLRPTLVQLGSGSTQAPAHYPLKKFNAVNINKKFLEKNSAVAALATASSASAASKTSSSISRPQIQTTQSHSRLVTAKLTGSPAPSTTTGPGWSRPTSTAPSSTGTNSPIGSSPLPSAAVALSVGSAAPQLPHVGKVIQPQPRAAILQTANLQKEGVKPSAKTAWGNVKLPSAAPVMTSEDFPTAAEVAQASATRKPKQDDQKSIPESASAVKHRLEEEADTFRGVHLDPNAHHWDEMEEDNDDFLGGVIEFGDGKQYKVEATEPSSSPHPGDDHSQPVSKEDRFVDDFDRSWPKSKPSPTSSAREFAVSSPALSSRGTSLQGGQDFAHPQLFNERSNRLEPYSHGPRAGQSTYQGFSGPMSDRRDSGPRRDHPPTNPHMTRNDWGHHDMVPSTSLQGRDRDRESSERGRRSDMGPPPLPLHATRRPSQDSTGGRQLPPHLSPNMPMSRRLPSHDRDRDREGRFGPAPTSPQSSRFAPPSPAISHASLVLSPGSVPVPLPGGGTADLNEVTKDLMQNAAARAKARKQQEEAEREAQKERARKKAEELEKEREKEVVALIESAVDGVKSPTQERRPSTDATSLPKNLPRRPPSQRGQQRRTSIESGPTASGPGGRRPSFGIGTRASALEPSLASQSDSWRAKASPLPPLPPTPRHHQSRPPPATSESPPPPLPAALASAPSTALDHVANIAESSMNDLEVVDFSNMGQFVGDEKEKNEERVTEPEKEEAETETKHEVFSKARPTASDFFDDSKPTTPPPKTENVWRRKTSASVAATFEGEEKPKAVAVKEETTLRASSSAPVVTSMTIATPTSPHLHLHPRLRPHAEASMSALDDVMSRIKGAIDGIQASGAVSKENRPPAARSTPHRERWQPAPSHPPHHPSPPSQSRAEEKLEELRESLSTSSEPSYTPPRSSASLPVQLPKVSHSIGPIPRKQHFSFSKPPIPARFELLSFEPPVQGMNKRDFSVNSVLFRSGGGLKGNRIRILLPPGKGGYNGGVRTVIIGPKYGVGGSASGFGRGTNADGATSWRKASAPTPAKVAEEKGEEKQKSVEESDSLKDGSGKLEEQPVSQVKPRQQPKMPAGSVVAFIRDSKIDVVEADPKPLVNFIVTSELDEPTAEAFSTVSSSLEVEKKIQKEEGAGSKNSVPLSSADGVKTSARSISAPSPSHQSSSTSTPWGKPSFSVPIKDGAAVRAPDPEHLRAVWSQPNKADLNPVNSLEGIADDLTSVPFSVLDVKSEDGETPPPALPSTTSRMSLHEVTKAFQKVPSSSPSNSSTQRGIPISSPSNNHTPATRLHGELFELLSFEPPVQGMNKRDFSVNSVLFRSGGGLKGNRIRILLPPGKGGYNGGVRTVIIGPKYGVGGSASGFGRGTNADGATSWRKASAPTPAKVAEEKGEEKQKSVEESDSLKDGSGKLEEQPVSQVKPRQQPKMPAGSVVAFIRDSKIDVVEADPKPLVNFIVTSELDEPTAEAFSTVSSSLEVEKKIQKEEGAGSKNSVPLSSADGVKTSGEESSACQTQSSTASSPSAMVKLKALEPKAAEEPVTFQKVPSSSPSNSSTQRGIPISSPSNNHTPATRSPYPYSPMPPNAMRLPYEHYSPMLSHSPSPTVIYPHQLTSSPVPSRMPVNGHSHAPMYQAPVWIQPTATGPGTPGAIMRPGMTPYPAPMMMPYGTPGTPMYPMGAIPAPAQAPVGTTAAGRGRSVPMMSPAMSHAHPHAPPMYASSPVMMPMQPVPPHQNHTAPTAYMGLPPHNNGAHAAGRGQPRSDGSQNHHPQPQAANATGLHGELFVSFFVQ
ncbi:hypothetical protein AN958_01139 [Leucoagaricus sp. SymC.cos]|nr:hypothetical protein AN958_01139 [Leucoagaricus sp. SymC.cos]